MTPAVRAGLSPAARSNLDVIAGAGGRGRLRQAPGGSYTLALPGRDGRMEPARNVHGRTLRDLHAAGLIEYPDGDAAEPVALTAAGWAAADPSR